MVPEAKPNIHFGPYILYLALIPLITVLGVYLQNNYHVNTGILITLIIISSLVLLIHLEKIPKQAYPFTIFIAGLSLLLHTSLISDYLWGWDIHREYYSIKYIISNSIWDPNIHSNINSMLSIVILGPSLSILSGIGPILVLKLVYPLIFSFVPLGLYIIYSQQMDEKIAFLATFIFISVFTFFTELPQLARQEVAELFVIIIILLIIDKELKTIQRILLLIVISLSLTVSHYGTDYVILAILVVGFTVLSFKNKYDSIYKSVINKIGGQENTLSSQNRNLSFRIILIFIIISLTWYIFTSNSSPFISLINIGNQITTSFYEDFLNPNVTQGANIVISPAQTALHQISKGMHILVQFFIIIGFIKIIFGRNDHQYNREFLAFGVGAVVILIGCLVLPYFASSLNTTRLYHISLIFLSPAAVLGLLYLLKVFIKRFKIPNPSYAYSSMILSTFIVLFLLFNSGFVYNIMGDEDTSFALNPDIDHPLFDRYEASAAKWHSKQYQGSTMADDDYRLLLLGYFVLSDLPQYSNHSRGFAIFIGENNLENQFMMVNNEKIGLNLYEFEGGEYLLCSYDSGKCEIWVPLNYGN